LRSRDAAAPAVYQVETQRNVYVAMRDGVRLAVDLHRPSQDGKPLDGPFPVLLQRTPYNKSTEVRDLEADFFAARGYVVAIQDCRGRHASEGGFTKYISDGPDGYDTVEWLAQQPWSSGKIGTFGLSYAAHTQAALACLNPRHLACMWLECGGFSDAFLSGCRNGGAFELRQVTWAFREAKESAEIHGHPLGDSLVDSPGDPSLAKAAIENQDIHQWFQYMPWKKGQSPLRWTPDYENYLLELWGHEIFDDYWRQLGLSASTYYQEFSDVPQVHMGCWYDPYARTTTDNYVALSGAKTSPVSLLMGPWTHGGHSLTYSGDIDLGDQATVDNNLALDFNHLRLGFFDRWLKGVETAWEDGSPVKIFVMGGGSGRRDSQQRLEHGGYWRSEKAWPLPRAQDTAFYLQAGGGLSREIPQSASLPSTYLFDPNHPAPTIGGNISSGVPIMYPGGFDQKETPEFYGCSAPFLPLSARPDVLAFQTGPLTEDTEVTGPVSVRLWITSDAVDTDFTAKLLDVYPPSSDYPEGYALNLTDGILRAKFRDSWEQPELLEPGVIYQVTIQLFPTSNLFVKGHRIRLDVSSSNFPRFDVNGNTGENPGISPVKVPAQNSVYHDSAHPSHVILPVIPAA